MFTVLETNELYCYNPKGVYITIQGFNKQAKMTHLRYMYYGVINVLLKNTDANLNSKEGSQKARVVILCCTSTHMFKVLRTNEYVKGESGDFASHLTDRVIQVQVLSTAIK